LLWPGALKAIKAEDNFGFDTPKQAIEAIMQEGPEWLGKMDFSDPENIAPIMDYAYAKGAKGKPRSFLESMREIVKRIPKDQEGSARNPVASGGPKSDNPLLDFVRQTTEKPKKTQGSANAGSLFK
jgi:hypothetical protein